MSQVVEDLTLLLVYLTSWREEPVRGFIISRAWKGYDFDVLNELSEKGMITDSRRAKSVCLTDEGVARARELERLYVEGVAPPGPECDLGEEGLARRHRTGHTAGT